MDQMKKDKEKKKQKEIESKQKQMGEATMTPAQKSKDTMLKKQYDKSDMKKSMQKQYGKEEGKKVYFATIRKQAMGEMALNPDNPNKGREDDSSREEKGYHVEEKV